MGVFTVFIISWCVGLVFFPTASIISTMEDTAPKHKIEKKKNKDIYIGDVRTVFLNDFNHKEIFVLDGNFSDKQIIEHDGSTYLVYLEKIEGSEIFMCAKNMDRTLPEPGLPEYFQEKIQKENLK